MKFNKKIIKNIVNNMFHVKHLHLLKNFVMIGLCNKYNVNWSGSEGSSHVIPCLCALFFWSDESLEKYFEKCIEEARLAALDGDVPIGAVLVLNDEIIAYAHNTREKECNILGHAEINAILKGSALLGRWNLADCELYVTLEPCSMCCEVIKQSRISNVYYLLNKLDYKKEFSKTNFVFFKSEYEQMYSLMLSDFFKKKR